MKNLLRLVKNLGKAQSKADKTSDIMFNDLSRANSQSSLLSNSAVDDKKYSIGESTFFPPQFSV